MHFIDIIHSILCGPALLILLLGIGLFFTLYLNFPQIRFLPKSIRLLLGKDKTSTNKKGDTSAMQALATSLGGSIGVGCIAGTGMAINIGGPSTILWMVITALIGMATKYVEVVLCHKYRKINKNGSISGTPMFFLKDRLNFKILSIIMAIAIVICSFLSANMPQANTIAKAIYYVFGIKQVYTGIFMSIIISLIIVGGIKRIGIVAEKLIPIMSLIFLIISIITIGANYKNIIPSLRLMFCSPFKANGALGGFLGTTLSIAIFKGVNKSYYTNDAGSGASGIAHAASDEESSFNEGVYSIIEPFLCTAVMCTLTGLVITSSGVWNTKFNNKFDFSDITILKGVYKDDNDLDIQKLKKQILKIEELPLFNSNLKIENGKIKNKDITVLCSRSIASDIKIYKNDKLFFGEIKIRNGKVVNKRNLKIIGKSLLSGVNPVSQAFVMSPLGRLGPYLLNLCLILFALTTVIAWFYYGDRGLDYLGAGKIVLNLYKFVFIFLFFLGCLVDTSITWKLAEIVYAFMAIPNLIGIFLLRKEVKEITKKGTI
ncbi:MAG: sodium:alanine symporter family protein [Bacteroidetes bacterium]|nr:sodium:alanine symporter family protein [Bacteroidota bacterium]